MSIQEFCPRCDGTGIYNSRRCSLCNGDGTMDTAVKYDPGYSDERRDFHELHGVDDADACGPYTTTHITGPLVTFGKLDRAIQRCACCGFKLEDLRPSCTMFSDADQRGLPQFAEAHLIQVKSGNPKRFLDLGDFREVDLPDDFCLALVEQP